VDVGRAVPGAALVGSDVVVLGAVGVGVAGELEGVGDLFEEVKRPRFCAALMRVAALG
jgi:hypothetical protein